MRVSAPFLFFIAGLFTGVIADTTNLDTAKSRFPTLPEGFEISLFASEPLVRNPTCVAFDRLGRAFVAQGPQFRKPKKDTPGDSIKILIDRDDDGIADEAKTFAHGFNSIHGLAWKGNDLYVANAPDFTIVRDTDGDNVADEYIRIYTDLGNVEHSLHGLNWGPDGKLYMSKGNSKGLTQPGRIAPKPFRELWGVESPAGAPDLPPAETFTPETYRNTYHNPADDWGREGGILRCDLMGKNLEITSRGFRNPWDMAMNDTFDFIGTDNDQNEGDKIFMPFFGAHFGWGHTWSYNWSDGNHLPTAPHSGPFFNGSGTGVIYYSLDKFPERYRNVFFINDWGRKCTYVMRPRWNGALLQSDTGDEPLEIFADANGSLFKPSDIEVGPDGALWILGWGNGYGVEWNGDPKLENQINEGRIFRVWHRDNQPDKRTKWLTAKRRKAIKNWTQQELIDDLTQPIAGWRTDAQDELLRRNTPQMNDALIRLAKGAKTPSEETWLTWTLALHQTKTPWQNAKADQALIRLAKGGGSLNQQVQALRAIRLRLAKAEEKTDMIAALGQVLGHKNVRVRFATIQTIRQAKLRQFARNIVRLAASETDRITFYAAWGAMRELLPPVELRTLLRDERAGVRRATLLALLESQLVTPAEAKRLVNDPDPGVATVAALYLSKVERDLANLLQISPSGGEFVGSQTISIRANINDTRIRYTLDGSEPNGRSPVYREPFTIDQSARLRAAIFRDEEQVGPIVKFNFEKIDLPSESKSVVTLDTDATQRVVRIASGLHEGGRAYLDRQYRFTNIPDSLKGAAYLMPRNEDAGSRGNELVKLTAQCLVDVYVAHDRRVAAAVKPAWLKRFEPSGLQLQTSDAQMDLFHRRFQTGDNIVLGGNTTDGTDSGKSNYIAVFSQTLLDPQPKPVTQAAVLAAMDQADAGRGRQIFFGQTGPQCATCHEVNGAGKNFGPELSGIGSRDNAATILQSILQPNARLVEGYRTHIVEMKDGKTYAGMALQESGLTFNLGLAAGQSIELDKKQIANRTSAETSPMPPNFGVLMNAQQLADLTAFLVSCKDEARAKTTPKKTKTGVQFQTREGEVTILINGQIVGTYVHNDPVTLRPFFKNIRTLSGVQVTRNHPPVEGVDDGDHASMHPGIWMAFGDISGSDFWRNRAHVVHERFITKPSGGKYSGSFSVSNRFETNAGKLICRQTVTHAIRHAKDGWLLTYDCDFTAPTDFYFGDQEEMGLGVRLATLLIEKNGGQLRNSAGQVGAKSTWGQPAIWCDYSGNIDGKWAGITILANGKTPRVPWWHNRNYGLMVANQFGRKAMKQGEKSQYKVKGGSTLQLSFTVIIHEQENSESRINALEALTR